MDSLAQSRPRAGVLAAIESPGHTVDVESQLERSSRGVPGRNPFGNRRRPVVAPGGRRTFRASHPFASGAVSAPPFGHRRLRATVGGVAKVVVPFAEATDAATVTKPRRNRVILACAEYREGDLEFEKPVLSRAVERRLEFVEVSLFWEGHVNRGDLADQFGVSANQASFDLTRYSDLAPGNTAYDTSARSHVRCAGFSPVFNKIDARSYLAQLRVVADGIFEEDDCWIGGLPNHDSVPTPALGVDSATLRAVVEPSAVRKLTG